MLKNFLVFLSLFFLSVNVFAEQANFFSCKGSYDTNKAKEIMDKVQKKYLNIQTIHSTFIQSSYLAAVDTSEGSSGEVWLAKPDKMKWQYLVPEEQMFLMNGNTLWYYQPLDQQVLIQNFEEVVLTDLPVAFLLGMGDLRRDFTLLSACKAEKGVVLKLKPAVKNEKKEELEGFGLLIDPDLDFPIGAEIIHVGGNRTAILLENIKLQEKINDTIFAPEFPKGIDINDMRNSRR